MIEVTCAECGSAHTKRPCEISKKQKRSSRSFCSKSCAGRFNNKNKSTGIRRSKNEAWIEQQLSILYSKLDIHFNRKDAVGSELDIYLPSLKLAFELNGIFHYEPIYGDKKHIETQVNDGNKFQACQAAGISLCVIDTSRQKYFKPATSQCFLDIIIKIVTEAIAADLDH